MKTKLILYSLGFIAILFSSCEKVELGNDFLEKAPSVDITKDTIFGSLELSKRYLTRGYATLPYGLNLSWGAKVNKMGMDILESLTDLNHSFLSWGGANQVYYSGSYSAALENTATNTKYHYIKEESWDGIRIGWNFIENADKIPDASIEEIEKLKAEAKVLIAVHYIDMYRHFGGLPWVDHAYKPTESTILPRSTSLETLNNIVALLDEAIPHLPWKIDDITNEDGRFTQASAMGLKARVLLFGASPLFNSAQPYLEGEASDQKMTWHGGYDANLWTRAKDAAKDLLDKINAEGYYTLVSTGNYRKDFQNAYYQRGNSEILASTRAMYKSGGYWAASYYFYQSSWNYQTASPTKEYVDMFPMANGTPIDAEGSGWDPNNPYENRDPRLYETMLVNGDAFRGRTAQLYLGGLEKPNMNAARTGVKLRKFWLDGNPATSIQSIVQWPLLRLPEVYLSYAEALNEANGGPTTEAYNAVNTVRARVGLGNLPTGLSQVQFREAVLRERALEFGFEEVRWFDIIRWKMEDAFTKTYHGVNITRTNGVLNFETVELPERYWKNNWSPKWYLSAFPPDEINKGYGLVQNPGW